MLLFIRDVKGFEQGKQQVRIQPVFVLTKNFTETQESHVHSVCLCVWFLKQLPVQNILNYIYLL